MERTRVGTTRRMSRPRFSGDISPTRSRCRIDQAIGVLSLAATGPRAPERGASGWAEHPRPARRGAVDRARVAALELRPARKDAIIADIAAEHLALK